MTFVLLNADKFALCEVGRRLLKESLHSLSFPRSDSQLSFGCLLIENKTSEPNCLNSERQHGAAKSMQLWNQ